MASEEAIGSSLNQSCWFNLLRVDPFRNNAASGANGGNEHREPVGARLAREAYDAECQLNRGANFADKPRSNKVCARQFRRCVFQKTPMASGEAIGSSIKQASVHPIELLVYLPRVDPFWS
jgi:hypothetical protein